LRKKLPGGTVKMSIQHPEGAGVTAASQEAVPAPEGPWTLLGESLKVVAMSVALLYQRMYDVFGELLLLEERLWRVG